MLTRAQINLKDNYNVVHAKGCGQADYTLCGMSTDQCISDYESFDEMKHTTENITCKHCIAIIKYARTLKLKQ